MSKNHVVVIGAGLLGLTSAYFLRDKGFEVTVVEKAAEVALGASYANGGLLTPSMAEPWNSPGVLGQLIKYLGDDSAPMLLRPTALHHYIGWGLKFLKSATQTKYHSTTIDNIRLSQYSLLKQGEIKSSLALDFFDKKDGTMKVFRDLSSFDSAKKHAEILMRQGLEMEFIETSNVSSKEPCLAPVADRLVGAIYYPGDQTGNARVFCQQLHQKLTDLGVKFEFSTPVESLLIKNGKVNGVKTEKGEIISDKVLITSGAWSTNLLSKHGIRLPVKPVKGYSVSAPLNIKQPLKTAIVDDDLHAAITPLGNTIRLAGTAEFCGWREELSQGRIDNLWEFFDAICPEIAKEANREESEPWCGFRPMSADGKPFLGESHVSGLYVNTGHGALGWSQCSGSASLISQIMSNEQTDIDFSAFNLNRKI